MNWTNKERQALFGVNACGSEKDVLTIASKAVELVAARGGTMTADDLNGPAQAEFLAEGWGPWLDRLAQHLAVHGARNAALAKDLEAARNSLLREGMERNRLEQHVSELEKALENARKERDEALRLLSTRVEASRLDALVEQVDAIRKRSLEASNLERLISEHGLSAAMRWVVDGSTAPERYPCSDTCTHDDAATPGHPERVRERIEDFEVALAEMEETEAFDRGAEAMRAACLDAALSWASKQGFVSGSEALRDLEESIKAASP